MFLLPRNPKVSGEEVGRLCWLVGENALLQSDWIISPRQHFILWPFIKVIANCVIWFCGLTLNGKLFLLFFFVPGQDGWLHLAYSPSPVSQNPIKGAGIWELNYSPFVLIALITHEIKIHNEVFHHQFWKGSWISYRIPAGLIGRIEIFWLRAMGFKEVGGSNACTTMNTKD